jgi:heme exporter protein CcmD
MDFAAPHAGFVAAAYIISAFVLSTITATIVIRDRRLRAQVEIESELKDKA